MEHFAMDLLLALFRLAADEEAFAGLHAGVVIRRTCATRRRTSAA
jgi:hypothetical protein